MTSSERGSKSISKSEMVTVQLPVIEDIPSELVEFVRLYKYGFWSEADVYFAEVLQDHISLFPIIAEYAKFLLEQGRHSSLSTRMEDHLAEYGEKYTDKERGLLRHYSAIGRGSTSTSDQYDPLEWLPALRIARKVLPNGRCQLLWSKGASDIHLEISDIDLDHVKLCLQTTLWDRRMNDLRQQTLFHELHALNDSPIIDPYQRFAWCSLADAMILLPFQLLGCVDSKDIFTVADTLADLWWDLHRLDTVDEDVDLVRWLDLVDALWREIIWHADRLGKGFDQRLDVEDQEHISRATHLCIDLLRRIRQNLRWNMMSPTVPYSIKYASICADLWFFESGASLTQSVAARKAYGLRLADIEGIGGRHFISALSLFCQSLFKQEAYVYCWRAILQYYKLSTSGYFQSNGQLAGVVSELLAKTGNSHWRAVLDMTHWRATQYRALERPNFPLDDVPPSPQGSPVLSPQARLPMAWADRLFGDLEPNSTDTTKCESVPLLDEDAASIIDTDTNGTDEMKSEIARQTFDAPARPVGDQVLHMQCPFYFLDCSMHFTDRNAWEDHCQNHLKRASPPTIMTCVHCQTSDSWDNYLKHLWWKHKGHGKLAEVPFDKRLLMTLLKKRIIEVSVYQELLNNGVLGHRRKDAPLTLLQHPAAERRRWGRKARSEPSEPTILDDVPSQASDVH
ncbi:hypothetical protein BDZ85DRAFT_18361 [Elsinoe ampelina]|uniref:Uncharacterized protein n=1 Tax=Elsinoe ampelina TaxID=302913 RepID=A0A6A6G706_9PEZI|nr:hypothetical protein BDZ85DRAFT_18361 [Elsinoe ampelina]